MPQEKIIIKFVAKDDNKLINAIDRLTAAQKNLQKGIVKTKVATGGATAANGKLAQSQHLVEQRMSGNAKTANILQGAFATLRNKLLLLSFAMTMAVRPILDLIKAQSDAEEIANKFNVVFGKQADVVRDWAGTFGQSVGRASSELQGMLATLQDTFVPLGFARKEATKLSISLTTLALDVASFNNKLDADVIRDFQSALVGNHETVRKYGIVITEAQLAAEALRSGIIETKRELTSQEKVQARLNLIIAGSKDAIGDLERTQESYANTLKRFNAEVRVTQEELGKALIPLATELLGVMTNLAIHFRDTDAIRNYTMFLVGVGISMSGVTAATLSLAGAFRMLKLVMMRSLVGGLVVGLGYLADRFLFASEAAVVFDESMGGDAIIAKRLKDKIADLAQEIDDYEAGLREANDATVDQKAQHSEYIKVLKAVIAEEKSRQGILNQGSLLGLRLINADKDAMAMAKLRQKQLSELTDKQKELLLIQTQLSFKENENNEVLQSKERALKEIIASYGTLHPKQQQALLNEQQLATSAKILADGERVVADALKREMEGFSDLEKAERAAMAVAEGRTDQSLIDFDIRRAETLIAEQAAVMGVVRSEEELNAILGIGISAYARTEEGQRAMIQAEMDIIVANSAMLDGFIDVDATLLKLIEDYKNVGEEAEEATTKFSEFWEKNQEGAELLVSGFSNMTSAIKGELDARMKNEMETLKASSKYQRAMARGDKDAMEQMEKDKMATFAKERKRIWFMEKGASFAEAGINVATAYTKALAQGGGLFGIPLATLVAGLGAVQLGLIAATQPPKFATGGMIGGRRHSQGGTMINAEAGEFVMSRSAVQSVGIENLNAMNAGGGGSAVTVNVSGNVLTEDFVSGELAENIKEAIRRGADFGIS